MRCYHSTSIAGISLFQPKKYWHTPDYMRSGLAMAGKQRPDGWLESDLFFAASRLMAPIFFSDKSIIKHCQPGNSGSDELLARFEHIDICSDSVILFDSSDRDAVIASEVVIYEFDTADFKCIPSGEFVTSKPLAPLVEHAPVNIMTAMVQWGYQVEFVDGLRECIES